MRDIFEEIFEEAMKAGREAGTATKPVPMVVGHAIGFSSQIDYSKPTEFVEDGVCGFAWVKLKPANHPFVKWAIDTGRARKDSYEGGASISIRDYNQSMQRKEAHARAMAAVLKSAAENGVLYGLSKRPLSVWSQSRMD